MPKTPKIRERYVEPSDGGILDGLIVHTRDFIQSPICFGEIELEQSTIKDMRRLFASHTLDDHKKLLNILYEIGLTSDRKYNDIHDSGEHLFSQESLPPTAFAKFLSDYDIVTGSSKILELGHGYGRDLIHYARLGANATGIDSSSVACSNALKSVAAAKYNSLVDIVNRSYIDFLQNPPDDFCVTNVCASSSLHYFPPEVLRNLIFPKIREILSDQGLFALSMKMPSSSSASEDRHIRLSADGYNPSLDRQDGIFRIYPNKDLILELVKSSGFEVILTKEDAVYGYDIEGDIERFIYLVCKAS